MEFNSISIPNEIIYRIINHLKAREIVAFLKTNLLLNDITRNCNPIRLDFSDVWILPSQLLTIAKQFADISELTASRLDTEGSSRSKSPFMLDDVFRVAPNLTTKHIKFVNKPNAGQVLLGYKNYPIPESLESFVINVIDCGQLGSPIFPNSLTELSVESYNTPSNQWKYFPKSLTSLKIATVKYDAPSDVLDLPNLIDLQLECEMKTQSCQLAFFTNLPPSLGQSR